MMSGCLVQLVRQLLPGFGSPSTHLSLRGRQARRLPLWYGSEGLGFIRLNYKQKKEVMFRFPERPYIFAPTLSFPDKYFCWKMTH